MLVEGIDKHLDLPGLVRLGRLLDDEPGVAATIGPASPAARAVPGLVFSGKAPAARYLVVLDDEPHGGPAIDTVDRLRSRMPSLLDRAGLPDARVSFAGDTALAAETVDTITHDLARIGLAAFLVNFLLLAIFLRSLVAPLYLVLASTLALAASIGLTTLVFQGFLGHDELTYFVPFAVAVLLLSLGSDYNVFVVGRIWQTAEQMPLRDAIATAAPRASRAIAVAGLALACVVRLARADRPAPVPRVRVRDVRRRAPRRLRHPRAADPGACLARRRLQLVAAVASDHKNSPSRLCFRPFIRLTFRFRVQPPGSTST